MSALKIESFCLDPSERWIFAGDASGQILVIDIDDFSIIETIQAHVGVIQAITAHKILPYLAALSTDRTVSVWSRNGRQLSPFCLISLRDIRPSNDKGPVPFVHSTSQALGFHDAKPRIVTRSGNAGVVELEFDTDGSYHVRWCVGAVRK